MISESVLPAAIQEHFFWEHRLVLRKTRQ